MTFPILSNLFKESKEKINQFAELQKYLYDVNVYNIDLTYHYIIDKKIIQNDNDLKYFIKIIIYGCEIRPFQIAIYAHLCTLIHLYSQKSKNQQFINFKKILKEYLFKNFASYNQMLFLYELMIDDFIDFQEINEKFIEISETDPKFEKIKNILFFFAPELCLESEELYRNILLDFQSHDFTKLERKQYKFIISDGSKKFDFYRFCRLNGPSSQLFKAIAVDNIDFLLKNFNESIQNQTMENCYFQRFEYLNHSPSLLVISSYFDSINCFKFLLDKCSPTNKIDDCIDAAAAGGAKNIFSFLLFEKNVKINEKTILNAVKYNQHQILEIIINHIKNNEVNYFKILLNSLKSYNLSCFLSSINSSEIFTQQNEKKQTILMIAAKQGIPDLINFIIQYYPFDIYHRDNKSRSLVYYAIKSSNFEVIQLVLSLYKKDDPFLMMNEFIDRNSQDSKLLLVENIICLACKYGTTEIVDYLLNLTKSNINTCSLHNFSLLHCACQESNIDVVRYLLSKKDIDINIKDKHDQTPLYFAIKNDSYNIVNLLLEDSRLNIDCLNYKIFYSFFFLE